MAVFNSCILAGNLTRDPELRYLPKGTAVASGSLAINRTWKSEDGTKREEVSFIEWRAFGRTAEVIAQYFKRGGNILLQGRLNQERWEDKATSQQRSKVVVIVETFQFLNRNGGDEGGKPEPRAHEASQAPDSQAAERKSPIEEDDIPF